MAHSRNTCRSSWAYCRGCAAHCQGRRLWRSAWWSAETALWAAGPWCRGHGRRAYRFWGRPLRLDGTGRYSTWWGSGTALLSGCCPTAPHRVLPRQTWRCRLPCVSETGRGCPGSGRVFPGAAPEGRWCPERCPRTGRREWPLRLFYGLFGSIVGSCIHSSARYFQSLFCPCGCSWPRGKNGDLRCNISWMPPYFQLKTQYDGGFCEILRKYLFIWSWI